MLRKIVLQASSTQRHRGLFRPFPSYSFRQCSSSPSSQTSQSHFVEHSEGTHLSDDSAAQPSAKISVDRSGLYNPAEHSHEPSSDSELVKHLKGIIKGPPLGTIIYTLLTRQEKRFLDPKHCKFVFPLEFFRGGPISVAEYMEEVLTNPKAGFYINRDVFGAEGDFITSPEVSQMFGEMVGVWAVCLWEQMGQPNKINLVELGPGRGTLMADLLRGALKFKSFTESLHIHMVECSPTLKKLQQKTLKCTSEDGVDSNGDQQAVSTLTGTPVSWHAALEQVPTGVPTIIIAHEFYDALPVHQFQRASRGWCEKMIDAQEGSSFRVVLSPNPTPANLYLAKRSMWAGTDELSKLGHVEICPKAMDLTQTIAKRVSSDGGGALIIDYGFNGLVSDSLQAIRKHKFVDILDDPGSADLSAYVDFPAIRHSAEEVSEHISVHGPITQSQFLGGLGINFRVEALLQNCTEEQAESLRTGYWRLVGDGEAPFWEGPDDKTPIGMGTRYLAMAIVNKNQGVPVPFQ